uniref:G domain-containing protein n=1 Tax=Astyanax mexicanus TaxID=7994 RepID=A0A3B1J197_ASTMX
GHRTPPPPARSSWAGKSSIINTIKSIFENRPFVNAPAATGSSTSYTLNYKKYSVGRFAIYDVKGLERTSGGVNPDDIINALKGHIKNGYKFGDDPINTDDEFYNISPGLNDKIHCLISVIPASNPSGRGPDGKEAFIDEEMVKKLKNIRENASKLEIPQVVFMTKVDKACPTTKEDLSKIYTSKKIKEKMEVCSNLLNVPMNCIFPVQNYHEENKLDPVLNSLMLDALNPTGPNDYLKSVYESQKHVE